MSLYPPFSGLDKGLPLTLIRLSFFLGALGKAGVLGRRGLKSLDEGGRVEEKADFKGEPGRDFDGLVCGNKLFGWRDIRFCTN